ncbi:PLP-dependent aminotransferase family protein [Paenibacillus sp. SC116]|uniref:aminotransferase-like domain-containing protein n=1 Tax=Paenibacillus sp. SC116 TaxID=2968986 RepID=UPI00215B5CB8|nr:PLP-dependent aminotransferase family protein [Paenibacillus sp. SC116]MCR8843731.1 PLP-dependent aminotransferase family protein [Paenibacillus sp. SC116]
MEYTFSNRIQSVQSSVVRDILQLTQGKSIISFAGGLPSEEWFPMEAIRKVSNIVLKQSPKALQYGVTEGIMELREQLAKRMELHKKITVEPAMVMLTSGSQQAIDLMAKAFIDPGDVVLVENPTYLACLQVMKLYGAQVVGVQSDAEGMIPEDLAYKLDKYRPKMVYVVPTFSNPTGRVWSLARRQALLEQCQRTGTVIFEDDPYGELGFTTQQLPTIAALEGDVPDRLVVYTSTFSKLVAPGLRTGWVAADRRIIQMLARGKQSVDLHSSVLDQLILSELLRSDSFSLDDHVHKVSLIYKERMETMITSLQQNAAWKGSQWNRPQGGMFLWLELPEGLDAEHLLRVAVQKGVAFVPGYPFYVEDCKRNTMRLNFSFASPEVIRTGMERLGEAIGEFTGRYADV